MGQGSAGEAGGEVGHQGDGQDLQTQVAGGDRLPHRGHAHQVGAQPLQHADLGRRLVVRPRQGGVDARLERWVDRQSQRAQPQRVRLGEVDEAGGQRVRQRARQRRRPRQVEVVGDQHRLPHRQPRSDAPGGVGQHHHLAPGRPRRPHRVHHGRRRMPLVAVHPPDERQHPGTSPRDERLHPAAVARHGRRREPREVRRRHGRRRRPHLRDRRAPPRAEHHRHVVALDPGRGSQCGSRRSGEIERLGGRRCGHPGEPTRRHAAPAATTAVLSVLRASGRIR